MIMSSKILSVVTFVYGLAFLLYLAAWIFHKSLANKLAIGATIAAAAGNLAGILMRWVESHQMGIGHAPLSNLFESMIFFALCIALISLFVEFKYKLPVIAAVVSPIPFLTMAYASMEVKSAIEPLVPALQSNWLIAHVMTCFVGYSAFAVAFGVSIMFFFKSSKSKKETGFISYIPDTDTLDELTHQMVMFGFLFLTIGIITGSVWANQAWGRYWGWDPKETWSLITWLIYASVLHARLLAGWRGKKIAVLSIIGFLAVIFTYFGVNLLPGLHSYQ